MQEIFYQDLTFQELCRHIVDVGNLQALNELTKRIADCNDNKSFLDPLDTLILYYIYYIWMPADLRADSDVIRSYLTRDANTMWDLLLEHKDTSLLEQTDGEYTDSYDSCVKDLVLDIAYSYSGGRFGKARNKQEFLYPVLNSMINISYQRFSDYQLKIMFMGNYYYGESLFSSLLEYNTFYDILFQRKVFLYLNKEDGVGKNSSIEDNILAMNLV